NINGKIDFDSFQNLKGGLGDNWFSFANGGVITGTVEGGTLGTDTLSFAGYTTPVKVDLQASTAQLSPGTTRFFGMEVVKGGTSSDTLVGLNHYGDWRDHSFDWTIDGLNSGQIEGICKFASFENLEGSWKDDNFYFTDTGVV